MSGALHLLVVDDDEVDRMAVRRAAQQSGAAVAIDELAAGPEVRARIEAAAAGGAPYDCLLVDHHMPGPSGIEVIRELRAAGLATPIVIMTGREDGVLAEALAAGATDFIHKSDLTPVRLIERLRHAVRLVRAESGAGGGELADLRRAVRMRDRLFDLAGHDLRNPLHSMAIALSELDQPELPDAMKKQYIAAARRSVEKMERLVRDLLDLGHLESGSLRFELQPTSVTWLLDQVQREHGAAAAAAGTPISLEVDGDPGKAVLDPARAQQAIGKLIANVLKHARASGPVTLRAARTAGDIEITLSDRGPGFPPAMLPHLFDREVALGSKRGSGLGLQLVHGLVTAQRGTISARNTDPGASLSLRFPSG